MASSLTSEFRVKGYKVVDSGSDKYAFDLVAAKGEEVVAVKVVERIDRSVRRIADDLRKLGSSLDLAPLLVCHEGASSDSLSTYRGIPSLSYDTFKRLIKGEEVPFIYFSRGGIYVKIRGEVIRSKRRERNMSLGELAYELGVSRRMVYAYETGRADATLEVASRLVRTFGEEVVETLSLKTIHEHFNSQQALLRRSCPTTRVRDPLLRGFLRVLEELGYMRYLLERAPFHIAAGKREEGHKLLIRKAGEEDELENRVTVDVARVCHSRAILVTRRSEDALMNSHVVRIPESALKVNELRRVFENVLD